MINARNRQVTAVGDVTEGTDSIDDLERYAFDS